MTEDAAPRRDKKKESTIEDLVQTLRDEYWTALEQERDELQREIVQYVGFRLADQKYVVPVDQVIEVTLVPKISRLPRSPAHLAGVINLRGRIIPVIDVRPLLKIPARQKDDNFRIVIARGDGPELGVVVEKVDGIVEADLDDIRMRSESERSMQDPYISGQVESPEGITIILDAARLIEEETSRLREGGP